MKALRFFGNLMLVDFFFLTCNMKILKNTEGKLGITLQWTFMHQSPGFHHWHFTNMVGPWTMWELGGQPHTVENLHITFDSLKIACWPEALHKQSDNTYFVCYMSVHCIPIINLKKMLLRKIHLQFLLKKKNAYKWTCTLQTYVVQGSSVFPSSRICQSFHFWPIYYCSPQP